MQTFLPHYNFSTALECLDSKRLGKQRLEAKQIIDTITLNKKAWSNHPAVRMWRGYVPALIEYYNESLRVFEQRGYKNIKLTPIPQAPVTVYPPWHNTLLCVSHQSNLIRKGKEKFLLTGDDSLLKYYTILWPNTPDNLPYYWPV